MEAISVTVAPEPESGAVSRTRRRPAQRTVTREATIPSAAPLVQQVLACIVLLALVGGSIYLLAAGDSIGLQVAGAAVLVLAAFVLIVWAAAALGTGLGPKQLLEILKTVIDAVKASSAEKEPDPTNP